MNFTEISSLVPAGGTQAGHGLVADLRPQATFFVNPADTDLEPRSRLFRRQNVGWV
jgi:hypothetical protein